MEDDEASGVSSDESFSSCDTSDDESFDGAPLVAIAFNIAKGIVGIGILSLPAGAAAGTGLIPALVILLVMYFVLMYTFWVLGRCCDATHQKTHAGVAAVVRGGYCFGSILEITNIVGTILGCAGYSIVIGKSAEDLWRSIDNFAWYATARGSFLLILAFVLLPLCLLRDLSKLAFTSFVGVACELFVVFFMVVRFIGGDYHEGGRFYAADNSADKLDLFTINTSAFVLVGSGINAFIAHWNSPKFFHQLRNRNPWRFWKATMLGFTIALVLYLTCMTIGYITFGSHCHGDILQNYSPHDKLAAVSRVAMLVATVFGFPINFTGLRTATLALFRLSSRRRIWVTINLSLLAIISIIGCTVSDLGLLASLGGASTGALVTLTFPGLMMLWTYQKRVNQKDLYVKDEFPAIEGFTVAWFLTVFGIGMAIFSTSEVVLHQLHH